MSFGPDRSTANQQHPAYAQHDAEDAGIKQKLGLRPDESIEIVDWNGPDDPGNP